MDSAAAISRRRNLMTKTQNPDAAAVAEAEASLREEHRQMADLLNRICGETGLPALRTLLDELHTTLKEHYAHEEYPGGLYDSMGALSREFRDIVRQLVDEHYRMLSAVSGLSRRARDSGEQEPKDLIQEAHQIVASLRLHESREHELAAAALRRAENR